MKFKHPKIYSNSQVKRLKESGKITKEVLSEMKNACVIGKTLLEVDEVGRKFLESTKSKSASYQYRGFPRHSCISVDETVLHGIPDQTIIKDGMVINIDCPVKHKGMYTDAAINVEIGEVNENKKKLNKIAYNCLLETIDIIKPGVTIGEICKFQESYASKFGYKVVKTFRGHGVGINLHEPPYIPYFYDENNVYNDYKLKCGNVFTIEPLLVTNDKLIVEENKWGHQTEDDSFGTYWEHTILVTQNKNEILT